MVEQLFFFYETIYTISTIAIMYTHTKVTWYKYTLQYLTYERNEVLWTSDLLLYLTHCHTNM